MPSYYKQNTCCELCGLPIPDTIVSPHHPLYGTIDHIIPRADGGGNSGANRQPAHRVCNQIRGRLPISEEIQQRCRETVFGMCPDLARKVLSKKARKKLRQRIDVLTGIRGDARGSATA